MNKSFYLLILRSFIIFVVFSVVCISIYYILSYMYPFIVSFIFASILQPIILTLERSYNMKRNVVGNILISLITIFSLSCLFLFLYFIIKETIYFITNLPEKYQEINEYFIQFGHAYLVPLYEKAQTIIPVLPNLNYYTIENTISFITQKLYESSTMILTKFFSSFTFIITSVSDLSIVIIIIFISTYFMTKDYDLLKSAVQKVIPSLYINECRSFIFHCKQAFLGLIKTHFSLAFISSVIALFGFLVFKFDYALPISVFILFIDLLPYIGIGLLLIPWTTFLFISGDYAATIQLACLYILIIIVRQIIEPKLISTHLQIHPLITLIFLFITYQHFGLYSFFITPLLLIILSALYKTNILSLVKSYILAKK